MAITLERWSAGTFLAKAKELARRLRLWHVHDGKSPEQFGTQQDAWRWEHTTFRELLVDDDTAEDPREPPLHICGGVPYEHPPVADTDRFHTLFLLAAFLRHIDAAQPTPAVDYLRLAFASIIDLPAWQGCEPEGEDARRVFAGTFLMTGQRVPVERLDTLVDAAEKLLDMAPDGWGSPAVPTSPIRADGADSGADRLKKKKKSWPDNNDVARLYKHIQQHASSGRSMNDIALDFKPQSEAKVQSLLRQMTRYKQELLEALGPLGVDS